MNELLVYVIRKSISGTRSLSGCTFYTFKFVKIIFEWNIYEFYTEICGTFKENMRKSSKSPPARRAEILQSLSGPNKLKPLNSTPSFLSQYSHANGACSACILFITILSFSRYIQLRPFFYNLIVYSEHLVKTTSWLSNSRRCWFKLSFRSRGGQCSWVIRNYLRSTQLILFLMSMSMRCARILSTHVSEHEYVECKYVSWA